MQLHTQTLFKVAHTFIHYFLPLTFHQPLLLPSHLFLYSLLPIIFCIHIYEILSICSLFLLHNFTFTSPLLSLLSLIAFAITFPYFFPNFICNFASLYSFSSFLDFISDPVFKSTILCWNHSIYMRIRTLF